MNPTYLPAPEGLRSLCRGSDGQPCTVPVVAVCCMTATIHYLERSGKAAAAVQFPEGLVFSSSGGYFESAEAYWALIDRQK